jgi:hypothetical protein
MRPLLNWVPTYTTVAGVLWSAPELHSDEDDDRNDDNDQKKARVETCAEDVSNKLAAGQCEHHQDDAECD